MIDKKAASFFAHIKIIHQFIRYTVMIMASMVSLSYANGEIFRSILWERLTMHLEEKSELSLTLPTFLNLNAMVIFVFDADQPDSQIFASIVDDFGKNSKLHIKAYSKNGKSLPAFKKPTPLTQSVIDQYFKGIAMRYPLVVVMDYQGDTKILSQGVTDIQTLNTRLKAFEQQRQIKDLDTHMENLYWEDGQHH